MQTNFTQGIASRSSHAILSKLPESCRAVALAACFCGTLVSPEDGVAGDPPLHSTDSSVVHDQDELELRRRAMAAALIATRFLVEDVSTQGGYLWRYSSDLSLREGEGRVATQTVWVQPPGTPTVGEAFVNLFRVTKEPAFRDAALEVADVLRRGQMQSGGWQGSVELEPERSRKWAYRIHHKQSRKAKDQSSLDDDKTQSAIRFFVSLDEALEFKNAMVHEVAMYALDSLLNHGQLPNGGFPQVWGQPEMRAQAAAVARDLHATFPQEWSREYEGHRNYWYRFTLNDNLAEDVVQTLARAYQAYGDVKYMEAIRRTGDFLLLAQLPEPQPAWAQQYSFQMQPIWARKFEPPAITGSESQSVLRTLLRIYDLTGDRKYLKPIPVALDYLETSLLSDGRLARFYELQTNRPLYFTKDYRLTYSDEDVPTHYAFKIKSNLTTIRLSYQAAFERDDEPNDANDGFRASKIPSEKQIEKVLESQKPSGAWHSLGGLKYHQYEGEIIDMRHMVEQMNLIARFLSN
ncbi:MAG: pectate lyase [Aureliella sp.]